MHLVKPDDQAFCADCGVEQDTSVLTPVDVERAITKTLRDLRHGVANVREARDDTARARVEFDVWLAKARKTVRARMIEDGRARFTNAEVDDELAATDGYKNQALTKDLAQTAFDDAKDFQRMLEHRLDGLRTLASSLRQVT